MISPNDSTAKVFDIVYDAFTSSEQTQKEINFIKSQLSTNKPILDLGCGTGRHIIPLFKAGFKVTGIDNSKKMLNLLQEKLDKSQLTANIICKDIHKVRKFNQKFGGIICFWNAFSEIAKTDRKAKNVLNLLFNSLSKGGKLIIEQTNPTSFDPKTFEFMSKIKNGNQIYETSFKVKKYNPKTNTTTSKELIKIKEDGRLIKKLETEIVQKWWTKQELEKQCKEIGFSQVKFYGNNFCLFKEPTDKLVIVATK